MDCKCTVIWEYNSLSDDLGFRIGRTSTSYENPILNGCVEKMVMNKAEILKNIVSEDILEVKDSIEKR